MKRFTIGLLIGCISVFAATAKAINPLQTDDFEDGSTGNWLGGSSPANVSTGGPAGVDDNYLELTATGILPLGMRNQNQWTGNYAGINAITADVANFSQEPVELRLLIQSPFGVTEGGDFTSTNSVLVPADGQWYPISFPLGVADMTFVGFSGTGILADTLSDVINIVIRHQPGAPTGPTAAPNFNGQIGLDNIRATPEPATLVLMTLSGMMMLRRKRTA